MNTSNDFRNIPTVRQRLGNGTIVQFQLLADALRDDVNTLPLFQDQTANVATVLFASYDNEFRNNSSAPDKDPRYYKNRLCATFQFPDEVWKWLNTSQGCERFATLFDVTVGNARFDQFCAAVNRNRKEDAHELLLDAIARVPYNGILLSRFHEAVRHHEPSESPNTCIWFEGSEQAGFTFYQFESFTQGSRLFHKKQDEMMFHPSVAHAQGLNTLFTEFINPFTRGTEPLSAPSSKGWPYDSPTEPFHAFVVPAYDRWELNHWSGSMAGWLVFICHKAILTRTLPSLATSSWAGFTRAVRHFMREMRRARLNEFLEQFVHTDLEHSSDPPIYFRQHVHQITGWRATAQPCPSFVTNAKFLEVVPTSPLSLNVRLDNMNNSCTTLKPTEDIIFPPVGNEVHPEHDYYVATAKLARAFWQSLATLDAEREAARLRGRAEVSHDFSFTIRTTLSEMKDIAEELETLRVSPDLFPIESFLAFPPHLQTFVYPAELFAIAIRQACVYERDTNDFLRALPRIDWIERGLESGIDASLIQLLSNNIAKPLARGRLAQFGNSYEKIDTVTLTSSGAIPASSWASVHKTDQILLVGVIIELLREAFQHCDPATPTVAVEMRNVKSIQVCVTNSRVPGPAVALLRGGNQEKSLRDLLTRLPNWELADPVVDATHWERCLALRRH